MTDTSRQPTFIIAGAMRCRTTRVNVYLREHPEIEVSTPKEVHFFDLHFDKGLDWYEEHFPGSGTASAIGEATPDYLYDPVVPERIAATLPEVKIVLLLRDPVERARSHYWHNRSRNREDLEFLEALQSESERVKVDREGWDRFSYVDRGLYGEQLARLYEHVPPDRVLVQTFDDLESEPGIVFRRTCEFLGVDPGFVPDNLGRAVNAYVRFRSMWLRDATRDLPRPLRNAIARLNRIEQDRYAPITPQARRYIRDRTRADNATAEKLAGVEMPWVS